MSLAWRRFRWLVAAKFVSDLGTYFDMVALNAYTYLLTGSGVATALFLASRLGASFFASFFAGVLADRLARKRLLVAADLARAAAMLALAAAPVAAHLPLLYVAAVVLGAGNTFFDVALNAAVPVIVGEERRVRANGVLASAQSLAMAIGCAASGLFLTVFSYRWAFAFDAATYLFSATVVSRLALRTQEGGAAAGAPWGFFAEARSIVGYVAGLPALAMMLVIRLADALGSASHNVGLPIFATMLDPARPSRYLGVLYSAWALGKLGCALLVARSRAGDWLRAPGRAERLFGPATLGMSGAFVALFWVHGAPLLTAVALAAGFADGLSELCFVSRLQAAPDAVRGRLFGCASTALTVGFGGGMLLAAPLFDRTTPSVVVTIFHGIPLLLALTYSVVIVVMTSAEGRAAGRPVVRMR